MFYSLPIVNIILFSVFNNRCITIYKHAETLCFNCESLSHTISKQIFFQLRKDISSVYNILRVGDSHIFVILHILLLYTNRQSSPFHRVVSCVSLVERVSREIIARGRQCVMLRFFFTCISTYSKAGLLVRRECLHLIKTDFRALWVDENAPARLHRNATGTCCVTPLQHVPSRLQFVISARDSLCSNFLANDIQWGISGQEYSWNV